MKKALWSVLALLLLLVLKRSGTTHWLPCRPVQSGSNTSCTWGSSAARENPHDPHGTPRLGCNSHAPWCVCLCLCCLQSGPSTGTCWCLGKRKRKKELLHHKRSGAKSPKEKVTISKEIPQIFFKWEMMSSNSFIKTGKIMCGQTFFPQNIQPVP